MYTKHIHDKNETTYHRNTCTLSNNEHRKVLQLNRQ
jgi:hypothetical protein